jgi:hypothetical protein
VEGLRLLLALPKLPTCAECQKWLYDEDWNQLGKPDKPVPRPTGTPLPCVKCPKSREHNKPRPDRDLSDRNWLAWGYYHDCLADTTGLLPRDLIVVRNNGLIRMLIDQQERKNQRVDLTPLVALLIGSGKSK